MLQQLALLKGFDLDGLDPTGPRSSISWVECSKLAYADREAFYGDPDFAEIPMAALLSDSFNDARRTLIDVRASMELRPGRGVGGFAGKVVNRRTDARATAAGTGEPTVGRLGQCQRRHRCISTLSTATAIWCRPRRRAAGCNLRQ